MGKILYPFSPTWASLARTCYAARSHVLARLASLAQIGELARRLKRRKYHTLWGGTYLGLFTSCSATFWQLLVFRATFFVSSNFLYSEQFLWLPSNVSVKSKLQHPPWATPRAFDSFENYCSNSPLPGPKCRSNAPH